MSQLASNIHIGAARVFLSGTAPASGTPPTLTPHLDGVPTSGSPVEVGYTQGAATFTYKSTKKEVTAEQSMNPVDVFITDEMAQLEFTAMEHVFNTLKTAFDSVGSVANGGGSTYDLFYAGDGTGLVSVTTQTVMLSSRIRTAPTKFEVLTMYKVYNVEGVVMPYQRTTEAVYKVTLKALVDTTRNAGDRIFQWYREK